MRKLVAVFCMAALSTMPLSGAFGADANKNVSNAGQPVEKIRPPRGPVSMNKNIVFISGSISKIDTTVPESVKVEVLNDVDGKSHVVDIGKDTNILKVVEVGELKAGDQARVVAKIVDDKEIALSVVTGKLKEMQIPRPPAVPVAATIVKKDQTKK